MKTKFKLLVAAVALAAAGQASAALVDTTSSSAGSSLMLVVWDVAGNSYVRDLGVTSEQVVSGSYTATGTVSPTNSLFTTLFGSDQATDVSWSIVGDTKGATTNTKNIVTTVTAGGSITNNNFGSIQSKISNLIANANSVGGTNGEYNTSTDTTFAGSASSNLWSFLAGGANSFTTLGSSLTLAGFQQTGTITTKAGSSLTLAGSTNFTLDASGNVLVPAAVPLPAAVWLMGSGLLGLLGVGRRRKAVQA